MLNLSSTLMKYIISLIVRFWMTSVFWLLMNLRLSIIFLWLHKTVHHSLLIGCMISSVISWSSLNYTIVVIFITFYFVLFYFLLFYLFVCFYHYIYKVLQYIIFYIWLLLNSCGLWFNNLYNTWTGYLTYTTCYELAVVW